MRVEKFEGRKEVIKTEYTEKDLKAELNFYLSNKCCTRVTRGPEACEARTIKETVLQEAVVKTINQLISESSELKEIIKENIEKAITSDGSCKIEEIDKEMLKVQEEL